MPDKEHIKYGYKEGPVSVHFKTELSPAGELEVMHLSKDGQEIGLKQAQAVSLAEYIMRKYYPLRSPYEIALDALRGQTWIREQAIELRALIRAGEPGGGG